MELDFGNIFSKSLESFKKSAGPLYKIGFLLAVLPQIGMYFLNFFLVSQIAKSFQGMGQALDFTVLMQNLSANAGVIVTLIGTNILFFLLSVVINVIFASTIIKTFQMVRDGKIDFNSSVRIGDLINNAKPYFGVAIGLSLLQTLYLIGLSFLFIIPALIFGVYWLFSVYFLILEDKSITEAMSASKELVSGRWWTVFGYSFLMGLVMFVVMFVVGLGIGIFTFMLPSSDFIMDMVSYLINPLVTIFSIAFYENFYYALKEDGKEVVVEKKEEPVEADGVAE